MHRELVIFLVAFEFVRRVNDAQVKNLSLPRFESCVNCYLTGDNNIQLGFKKEKKPCFSALSSSLQSQLILYKYLLFVVPLWTGNLCILTLVWEQLFSKKKKRKFVIWICSVCTSPGGHWIPDTSPGLFGSSGSLGHPLEKDRSSFSLFFIICKQLFFSFWCFLMSQWARRANVVVSEELMGDKTLQIPSQHLPPW